MSATAVVDREPGFEIVPSDGEEGVEKVPSGPTQGHILSFPPLGIEPNSPARGARKKGGWPATEEAERSRGWGRRIPERPDIKSLSSRKRQTDHKKCRGKERRSRSGIYTERIRDSKSPAQGNNSKPDA